MSYTTKGHLSDFTQKLLENDKKIRDELKNEINKIPPQEEVKIDGVTITKNSDGELVSNAVVNPDDIKTQVETYMKANPVSANVGDGTVTYEKLDEEVEKAIKSHKILFADTVADIKDLPLYDGSVVQTMSFQTKGDGGGSLYKIKSKYISNNKLYLTNKVQYINGLEIRTTFEGDIVLNGTTTSNVNTKFAPLSHDINFRLGDVFTFSITYVSGDSTGGTTISVNTSGLSNNMLGIEKADFENGVSKKCQATGDGILSALQLMTGSGVTYNNLVLHVQLESGEERTEWSNPLAPVDGHSVLDINDNYIAEFTPNYSNRISMPQLGFFPNILTQDCKPVMDIYRYICRKYVNVFELFFPAGKWYFSETDIYTDIYNEDPNQTYRAGAILTGISGNVGTDNRYGESAIMPFRENQKYVWNFGLSYDSTTIVGGYEVKNFTVSTGALGRTFCEVGILLTKCCYSNFDGLYFHYFNGSGLCIQTGWENHFGYLNFRGVGALRKDRLYNPIWIKLHPKGPTPSAVSACKWDYINFEGIRGSCIYCEAQSNFMHNEFYDIQAELTGYHKGDDPDIFSEVVDDPGGKDTDEHIIHTYIFKGTAGANYNSIVFHSISISNAVCSAGKFKWTDDNGDEQYIILRGSGVFGTLENPNPTQGNAPYGLNVQVGCLTCKSLTGPQPFPIFHSSNHKYIGGSGCIINSYQGSSLPYFEVYNANTSPYLYVGNATKIEEIDKIAQGKEKVYMAEFRKGKSISLTSEGTTPANIEHGYMGLVSEGGKLTLRTNGCEAIYASIYINIDNPESVNGNININIGRTYKDGTSNSGAYTIATKQQLINGTIPLKTWFEVPIHDMIKERAPLSDFELSLGFDARILVEYIRFGNRQLPYLTLNQLSNTFMLKSDIGAQLYCNDLVPISDSTGNSGRVVVFDGSKWKTLDGISLTHLINWDLINCTSNWKDTITYYKKSAKFIIKPDAGYHLESDYEIKHGETIINKDSKYSGEGMQFTINPVYNDIIVRAVAVENEHQTVTTNLTNCTIDNTSDYALLGGTYNATITSEDGYTLDSVTCVMHNNEDGTDTNVTVENGVISISKVTGAITITATATAI